MFSGIVQETGRIENIIKENNIKTFFIRFENCHKCSIGDSVAVNGTCLTVTGFHAKQTIASFDAVPETLEKTNIDSLEISKFVNIETAIRYGDFIGGHQVQGHIDEKGNINEIKNLGGAWLVKIYASQEFLKYLIPKGFVTIDGMSITVVDIFADSFSVTLIPHTIDNTIAKNYTKGSIVNLEADSTGKYIYKYMQGLKNV